MKGTGGCGHGTSAIGTKAIMLMKSPAKSASTGGQMVVAAPQFSVALESGPRSIVAYTGPVGTERICQMLSSLLSKASSAIRSVSLQLFVLLSVGIKGG